MWPQHHICEYLQIVKLLLLIFIVKLVHKGTLKQKRKKKKKKLQSLIMKIKQLNLT